MTADLADHPFSPENIARETGSYTSRPERGWMKFADECERLLGHSLDGNDPEAFLPGSGGVGYSLDEAVPVYEAGQSAHTYVAMVCSRERYDRGASVRS
mgnify:CR=1 FL=1